MKTFDFITIGGGSAGFNAARVAAALGKRVAVVDGAKALGGLCILRGCMPSKALLYAAEVLHLCRQAHTWGLRVEDAALQRRTAAPGAAGPRIRFEDSARRPGHGGAPRQEDPDHR
jgi:pyruvate/2-oxoglutarate dehydrogenase complex dihydrolipoamide dehydrogenase (E3) component